MTTNDSNLKRRVAAAWCAALILAMAVSAQAQISVIVAKSTEAKATKTEVKEIFTGAKLKWANGNKIQVVDQPDTELGKKFYDLVIGKSANQVRRQWTKLLLSGQAVAPIKQPSDKNVKKIVAGNPNAIGYIATSALDDSVREILRIEREK
jgi:ABC-type phosphate transport system substrate-binding protein